MSVSKDQKRKTWTVYIRYTDWQGKRQIHTKRGFKTKREAREYEREFLQKQSRDINMKFSRFVEIYMEDMKHRLKLSTYLSKEHLIRTKILPFFGERNLSQIDSTDVIKWQNEMLKRRDQDGNAYSQTYLRSIQNQLSAIFNYACRYYGLPENPSRKAGKMGKTKAKEMLFWTLDEYQTFIEAMKSKPRSYYAFELLYWCGIREGELLALTRADIDLEKRKLRINKSYQSLQGRDVVTSPKTEKSNRVIDLPEFLCEELPCKKTRSQDRLRHCEDTSKGPETRVNAEEMGQKSAERRTECSTIVSVTEPSVRNCYGVRNAVRQRENGETMNGPSGTG